MVSNEISAFDVEGPARGDWTSLDTVILLATTFAYPVYMAFAWGSLILSLGSRPEQPRAARVRVQRSS
jgi:hypothetical protein